jgi:hypothetical protein
MVDTNSNQQLSYGKDINMHDEQRMFNPPHEWCNM